MDVAAAVGVAGVERWPQSMRLFGTIRRSVSRVCAGLDVQAEGVVVAMKAWRKLVVHDEGGTAAHLAAGACAVSCSRHAALDLIQPARRREDGIVILRAREQQRSPVGNQLFLCCGLVGVGDSRRLPATVSNQILLALARAPAGKHAAADVSNLVRLNLRFVVYGETARRLVAEVFAGVLCHRAILWQLRRLGQRLSFALRVEMCEVIALRRRRDVRATRVLGFDGERKQGG